MWSKKDYERKLREEQEATAYVFQDFITTFQVNSAPPNKTFIKSAVLNPGNSKESVEKAQLYTPKPLIKHQNNAIIKNAIECARILKETKLERPKAKPKSNLELLKEEIKMRHTERDERDKFKEEVASAPVNYFDGGDPNSTNLFVANLNCKVTENDLMLLFGAYGPLASVKIMWPRGDDRLRNSNCGFVAFMSRKDAERALNKLRHREDMRVGWGKSVELPQHPIYIPADFLKLYLPPAPTGLPFNAQPLNPKYKQPQTDDELKELLSKSIVKVTIPLNRKILMVVNRMIEFVVREGPLFEALIMNREINNPDFNFLFDYHCPVHVYYRWKLFSILNGCPQKSWSLKPFRMYKGGPIWIPPVVPNFQNGMPEELIASEETGIKTELSDAQSKRLMHIIRNLTMTRCKVAEAMVFCLNHSEAIEDILDIIVDSLKDSATNPLKKIARIYLLSDVMYNVIMKKICNAKFEESHANDFVTIFKGLHASFKSLKFSLDKENFELRITKLLRYWDVCKIFSDPFIRKLECIFVTDSDSQDLSVSLEDDNSSTDEPLDGASLIKRLKNHSGGVVAPVIEDKAPVRDYFIPSKWDRVDPEEVEAQAMSTEKMYYMELERQVNSRKNKRYLPSSKWDSDEEGERNKKEKKHREKRDKKCLGSKRVTRK